MKIEKIVVADPDDAWSMVYGGQSAVLRESLVAAEAAKCLAEESLSNRYRLAPLNNALPSVKLNMYREDPESGLSPMYVLDRQRWRGIKGVFAGILSDDGAPQLVHASLAFCEKARIERLCRMLDVAPDSISGISGEDPGAAERFLKGVTRVLIVPPGYFVNGEGQGGLYFADVERNVLLKTARALHILNPIEEPRALAWMAAEVSGETVLHPLSGTCEVPHAERMVKRVIQWMSNEPHSWRSIEPILEIDVPEFPFTWAEAGHLTGRQDLRVRRALPATGNEFVVQWQAWKRAGLQIDERRTALALECIEAGQNADQNAHQEEVHEPDLFAVK